MASSPELRRYVGGRIREARERAGLSHDRAFELHGLGRQHQIKLEQGRHLPRPETLEKLAKAYGQPIDFFLPPEGEGAEA